jgi:hypothetical protein
LSLTQTAAINCLKLDSAPSLEAEPVRANASAKNALFRTEERIDPSEVAAMPIEIDGTVIDGLDKYDCESKSQLITPVHYTKQDWTLSQ